MLKSQPGRNEASENINFNIKTPRRKSPVIIKTNPPKSKPDFLKQTYIQTKADKKLENIVKLLKTERSQIIIFSRSKLNGESVVNYLKENNINSRFVHEELNKNTADKIVFDYRGKRFNVLVLTDDAAKDMQLKNADIIINFDIPKDVNTFTHRIGFISGVSGRGESISYICGIDDQKFYKHILFNYNGTISINKADQPFTRQTEKKAVSQKINIRFKPNKDTGKKIYPFEREKSPAKSSDYYNQERNKRQRGRAQQGGRQEKKVRPWRNY